MIRRAWYATVMTLALSGCSDPETAVLAREARVVLVPSEGKRDVRAWINPREIIQVPEGTRAVVLRDDPPKSGIVPGARFVRLRLESGAEVDIVRERLRASP